MFSIYDIACLNWEGDLIACTDGILHVEADDDANLACEKYTLQI